MGPVVSSWRPSPPTPGRAGAVSPRARCSRPRTEARESAHRACELCTCERRATHEEPSVVTIPPNIRVDVHLGAEQLRAALRTEARAGLTASPKELSPKWFYDERGSELFEAITRLPEYYPTRREQEILDENAGTVAD